MVRAAAIKREGEGVVTEEGLVPYKKVMDADTYELWVSKILCL